MVQLFIMRHGQAESLQVKDEMRQLTEQGKAQARQAGTWLATQCQQPDLVLVSPYVRAQQTLHWLQEGGCKPRRIETDSQITPSGSASAVHDYLDCCSALYRASSVLVVSHMPLVSYLLEEVTLNHQHALFATAAIAHIDYHQDRHAGLLQQWFIPD